MSVMYCFRNGEVDIGLSTPAGALPVALGCDVLLKHALSVCAEHLTEKQTWLVTGVAKAVENDDAHQALQRFRANVQGRLDQWRAEDALATTERGPKSASLELLQ
ncbi:MAG: hypothetical protein AAFQ10_03320 [Pseudomonadota bacterium]